MSETPAEFVLNRAVYLEGENARLRELLARAEKALTPFAFEEAKNIRWIFSGADDEMTPTHKREFKGQIIALVSGPWFSHMETPDLHQVVKTARDLLPELRAAKEDGR
jgi:hypothetical protein